MKEFKLELKTLKVLLESKIRKEKSFLKEKIEKLINDFPDKSNKVFDLLIEMDYYSYEIPNEYFRENELNINWIMLSKEYTFTSEQILEWKDNIDFFNLNYKSYSNLIKVIDKFDIDFLENLNWFKISIIDDLDKDFIKRYKSLLIWSIISQNTLFTEEELIQYKDYINWSEAFFVQNITEKVKEKVDFDFEEFHDYNKKKSEEIIKNKSSKFKDLKNLKDFSSYKYIHDVIVKSI